MHGKGHPLTLILNEKIQEDAERNIRHVSIRDYTDLYDVLRKFVSIPTTSSCARDKLRQIRQETNESVHSYIKRFRQQLNELIYAMQHGTKDSVKRAVAPSLETERAVELFVLNLRPEIEARVAPNKLPRSSRSSLQSRSQAWRN
jgi:hypothetical protein